MAGIPGLWVLCNAHTTLLKTLFFVAVETCLEPRLVKKSAFKKTKMFRHNCTSVGFWCKHQLRLQTTRKFLLKSKRSLLQKVKDNSNAPRVESVFQLLQRSNTREKFLNFRAVWEQVLAAAAPAVGEVVVTSLIAKMSLVLQVLLVGRVAGALRVGACPFHNPLLVSNTAAE